MWSNCLVFHTSGGISSSPAAFLFLIFLSTESSSSRVNGPSLMSSCLLIILVIGSCVTFGGFPSRFSKCCFHGFILSCWFVAFSLALAVLFLLLTSFIVCHIILDCLSSTESLILSTWFCMYSVCSFRYMLANSFCTSILNNRQIQPTQTYIHTHSHAHKKLYTLLTVFDCIFQIFRFLHYLWLSARWMSFIKRHETWGHRQASMLLKIHKI